MNRIQPQLKGKQMSMCALVALERNFEAGQEAIVRIR